MRMGSYSGTRKSETKTVMENGKKKTVTAAPIKFGEYSKDAQGNHVDRRTAGMSGAVPDGVAGEDVAPPDDRRLKTATSWRSASSKGSISKKGSRKTLSR